MSQKRFGNWTAPDIGTTLMGSERWAMRFQPRLAGPLGGPARRQFAWSGTTGFTIRWRNWGFAVELRLSLPILLWDNGKLKEIEDSMVDSQIAPNAVVAQNPDFVKLAEAFGARSSRPGTLEELQADLTQAFEADGPTLIYMTPDLSAQ